MSNFEDVKKFMDTFGQIVKTKPQFPDDKTKQLRFDKIIEELNELKVNLKLISDGDISGALLVSNEKYGVDIFMGIGGGPEGVLAASALDAYNCNFQGRFIFKFCLVK